MSIWRRPDGAAGQVIVDSARPETTDADGICLPEVRPGNVVRVPGSGHEYHIVDRVAAGSEGITFRAELMVAPGSHAVPVAIKQYRRPPGAPEHWPHDGTWLSLTRQAAFLSGLPKNDHLVWIREVFLGFSSEPDGTRGPARPDTPFVVMEWLDGVPPEALLHRRRPGLLERIGYVENLAEALAVLHSNAQQNPLSHADIKPDNAIITADRGLVLLDLGGLHLVTGESSGQGLFTEPFAAPEVLLDPRRPRGIAADTYSLGATAFWFVTGALPPGPDHAGYLDEAADVLSGCRSLRRPVTRRPRRRLVTHLLRAIAEDPAAREAVDPQRWARRLRRLARRPLIRRRLLAAALAAATLGFALSAAGLLPFTGPAPIDTARHLVHWNLLPPDPAEAQRDRYTVDFTRAAPGWNAAGHGLATTHDGPDGLTLAMAQNASPATLAAPGISGTGREATTATAALTSGQGAWGIWCRGTSGGGADRYRFLLTHAGAVGIFGYRTEATGPPREEGSGWWYLDGLDLTGPVTMTARCADVPVDGPVALRLSINGRTVAGYVPSADFLLSPGYSGLEAYSFNDVTGPRLGVTFSSFTIFAGTA